MAFLFLCFIVLAILLVRLWARQKELIDQIARLKSTIESIDRAQANDAAAIRKLTRQTMPLATPIAKQQPEPVIAAPVTEEPVYTAPVAEEPYALGMSESVEEPRERARETEPEPASARARDVDIDWESRIGGSWANKAGVAVLVIGLALFLQYSLTHLGPGGRVAVGYLLGAALLGTGIALEPRTRWRAYARGLIGGGWAALYFTSYAAHALSAARVITNPVAATLLLFAVSLAMVVHLLRYRSETVTGLSYFVAFGTLAITPLSAFAVIAVIPLAGSLLYLARRFQWLLMIGIGQVAIYLLYWIHIENIGFRLDRLIYGQIVLIIYWLLFEGAELSYFASKQPVRGALRWLFLVNAAAVASLSLGQWEWVRPHLFWVPCFVLALLFLLSTFVRAAKFPAATSDGELLERLFTGGYEGALTVSAALSAAGISSACHGLWITATWAVEAEVLFLCGLLFQRSYPVRLAGFAFALPIAKLFFFDIPERPERISRRWIDWSPLALFIAAVFLANRVLRRDLIVYTFAAATLLCTTISFELSPKWVEFGWLAVAALLVESGLNDGWRDFRFAGYAAGSVAGLGLVAGTLGKSFSDTSQIAAAALTAGAFARAIVLRGTRLPSSERTSILDACAALTALSLMGFASSALPNWLVAPAWFCIALAAMETGFRFALPAVRALGHFIVWIATFAAILLDLADGTSLWGLSHATIALSPIIAAYYYLRYRTVAEARRDVAHGWELGLSRIYLYVAALFSALLVNTAADRLFVPLGWALIGFVLLVFSLWKRSTDLRIQAYVVSLAASVRTLIVFAAGQHTFGISDSLLAGCPIILLFFASEFLLPRQPDRNLNGGIHYYARPGYSVMASVLLASLLLSEVRGSLLTVAWGAQGLITLTAGFPLRERVLRFSGLATFLLCVVKLFFYDLNSLSTPYRILSFIVLGVLLLGASGMYTRFRDTIRQFLDEGHV